MQKDFFGGVAEKIMLISNFTDRTAFLPIARYETMVEWFKNLIVSLSHYKDLRWWFHELKAFNFYTKQSVQCSNFVPFMEVFFIDSWDENKQDKQIYFSDKLPLYQGTLFH